MLSESAFNNREAYHNISSYLVHAKFNKDKLLSIVNQLINKHELLRACFVLDKDKGWSVIIYKSVPISYQIYTNKNGRELIANERSNTFDYARPALFRIVINDLGDKFNLLFSFHHVIEDGWSFASLINEFGQAYIYNKPIEARLNLRYGEFVRDELTAMRSQKNISFWKSYLKDLTVTKFNETFDKDKIEGKVFNSFFKLSSEQSESVHRISRALKISIDSIFLYIYFKTLSYFCRHSDVVVGWVVNNRLEKEGGDKMFGLFLNTIPFRLSFETIKTDISGLLDIFNNKLKLQNYKQLPYARIKELFKYELYDFVFNFVHLHILKDSANSIESVDGYERTNIPFTLTVVQKGETTFLLDISAQEGYVTKDFLEHFMAYYQGCLANVLNKITDISAKEALPFSGE